MHEIKRVANESTSGREDGQRAHRGDKQVGTYIVHVIE